MNRRNFFGTVGAAIAGVVLGNSVKAEPVDTWGFAAGDDLRLNKPGTITFNSVDGLRRYDGDAWLTIEQ